MDRYGEFGEEVHPLRKPQISWCLKRILLEERIISLLLLLRLQHKVEITYQFSVILDRFNKPDFVTGGKFA